MQPAGLLVIAGVVFLSGALLTLLSLPVWLPASCSMIVLACRRAQHSELSWPA